MKTNTTGAKINVVTTIVVKTFVKNPLAVTAIFGSRIDLAATLVVTQEEDLEETSLSLNQDFNPDNDYLVALTRFQEGGRDCQYTLLAGTAPAWFDHPEHEAFNLLGSSDTMDTGRRLLVALPLKFLAARLGHEKPRV
jgi:hypothetical protein